MTIQNYFTQLPDAIFIAIANTTSSDLKSFASTNKEISNRVNNLFSTLYICQKGHDEDAPYQVFFENTLDIEICSKIISEKNIRHLTFVFSDSVKRLPLPFSSKNNSTHIVSFKIYFIWKMHSFHAIHKFIIKMRELQAFNSLKQISLHPIVNTEADLSNALESVSINKVPIQAFFYNIRIEESLDEVVFNLPTYRNPTSNLQPIPHLGLSKILQKSSLENEENDSHLEELQIVLDDELQLLFLPIEPSEEKLQSIRNVAIKFPENGFKINEEHLENIFKTYSEISVILKRFSHLEKISIEPCFFDIAKMNLELQFLESLLKHIFQKVSPKITEKIISLDPKILYRDAGQEIAFVEATLKQFEEKFGTFLEVRNHCIDENSVVVTLQKGLSNAYYLKIREKILRNPYNVIIRFQAVENVFLLNCMLHECDSVERMTIQLPQDTHLPLFRIMQFYGELVRFISKFPNIKELHLTPQPLGNDISMQINYMYEAINNLLHIFQRTTITLCINKIHESLQQYSMDFPLIENNPYFTIEFTSSK